MLVCQRECKHKVVITGSGFTFDYYNSVRYETTPSDSKLALISFYCVSICKNGKQNLIQYPGETIVGLWFGTSKMLMVPLGIEYIWETVRVNQSGSPSLQKWTCIHWKKWGIARFEAPRSASYCARFLVECILALHPSWAVLFVKELVVSIQ